MALINQLKAIADAIRRKTGKAAKMSLADMVTEIDGIQTGSTDVPFDFGGMNARLIDTYAETFTLADTSFVTNSTAPSTATSIKATVSNRYTGTSRAWGDKDIVIVQQLVVIPVHNSSATGKAQFAQYAHVHLCHYSKTGAVTSGMYAGETTRRPCNASYAAIGYWNTSGVKTYSNASYGLYGTCQTPTVAGATANSTAVRVSSPVLYARYSSTYETQANMKAITACRFEWKVQVYEVDSKTVLLRNVPLKAEELIGIKDYGAGGGGSSK